MISQIYNSCPHRMSTYQVYICKLVRGAENAERELTLSYLPLSTFASTKRSSSPVRVKFFPRTWPYQFAFRYPGPRSATPGLAPVTLPAFSTLTPFTNTYSMPVES